MRQFGIVQRLKLMITLLAFAAIAAVALSGARTSAESGRIAAQQQQTPAGQQQQQTPVVAPAAGQAAQQQQAAPAAPAQQATPAPQPEGCISCHGKIEAMHETPDGKLQKDGTDGQGLSCTYCHGGNPMGKTAEAAHVRARFEDEWKILGKRSTANPERTNNLLTRESWEYVRFINPGDFRVTQKTCGECHGQEVAANESSMMRHGAMLWGAALYNNGGFPLKDTRFGEVYTEERGAPARIVQVPQPTREQQLTKGIIPFLDPLPRWQISQPGNVLRVFERGGKRRLEVGLPDRDEDPGKPDKGLSPRGLGTNNRTDPVFLGIQKTRLLDPTLNHLGTNDHPGDFRSSGCTACHVIYANDRSVINSGSYAKFGNMGESQTEDETILKNEPGHPIKHQLTNRIPTSQCMVCHMHPGTNMVATYLGVMWWDNETDGDKMYPKVQRDPSQDEEQKFQDRNPEGAAMRGNWIRRVNEERVSKDDFLTKTGDPKGDFNSQLKRTHFQDFHGHGWLFRAVFKKDRKGNFLDAEGNRIEGEITPEKLNQSVTYKDDDSYQLGDNSAGKGVPVHLKDIHLEKGMHCADCHFRQDSHGNGNLYNEPRAAIEINCADCHGTISARAGLVTTGPAAGWGSENGQLISTGKGRNLRQTGRTGILTTNERGTKVPVLQRGPLRKMDPVTKQEVQITRDEVIQNSIVEPGRWWRVKQTLDTITPGHKDYNEQSRYAKTIRKDNSTWGDVPAKEEELAHADSQMTCFSCHSSWMTSCFGCHLSMKANRKMPQRHNEGDNTRNYTTYNFQVLRDDVFMLAKDGTVTGHRVAPAASRSAVLVSSQNQNREWIYSQQQTVSAEGFAGQSFATHVPHTVRSTETKQCSDCHVSKDNDNNAWMAQTLMQGTNFVNFMGRYVYVAAEHSLEVATVTEHDEPQAVKGSTLHKLAYPETYDKFVKGGREIKTYFEHVGNPEVLSVQVRGEYAYVAAGKGGLRVYDIAQIDHKGFSERITTAPISRFGQKFWVNSKHCTAVAAPTTLGVDPARTQNPLNQEQRIHPLYAYLYAVDKEEGLFVVNAATLLDGDPLNNYLKRAVTWNPNGVLNESNNIVIAGTHAYITTDDALVIVNINNPTEPQLVKEIPFKHPKAIAVQFRYGFVADEDGLKVVDLTKPSEARLVEGAEVKLHHAHDVYVARTYAYVANGEEGIAIIDVEKPEQPRLDQMYNADGKLNDVHQVKVAMTNASLYAYVADGKNGLRILQLTDPETMPTFAGFSPRPEPKLIAWFHTLGPAIAVSKGLDRDRAVDESGNQLAVFGRRGSRPFNMQELMRMYLLENGQPYAVTDKPSTQPRDLKATTAKRQSDEAAAEPKETSDAGDWQIKSSQITTVGRTAAYGLSGIGLFAVAVVGWRRRRRLARRDGN
ncbi:MAG: hypothetical protein ACRD9R_15020 [Pyrinomonadaceae bacterium]